MASKKVKNIAVERGARTVSEQLHWSLSALRTVRGQSSHKALRDALQAYPKLAEWIDLQSATFLDRTALLEHISELARTSIEEQREELETMSDLPEYKKQAKLKSLQHQSKKFSSTCRRISLEAIRDASGKPAQSMDESVCLLRDHLGRSFRREDS
jgi:hypothetical protein